MKVKPLCSVCFLQRSFKEIQLVTDDPTRQFELLKAVIELFSKEFNENAIAAVIGTKRDQLIHQLANCPDPYKNLKIKSNEIAQNLVKTLEPLFKAQPDPYKRFRSAALVAIVGNSLEFDILEHSVNLENPHFLLELIMKAEDELVIDDIEQIYYLIQEKKEVLYLLDNAGEIIFDKFLILELLHMGVRVIAVVKESPVLNDATMEDAEYAGLMALSEEDTQLQIITTGTDHVGLLIDEISESFRAILRKAKMIIAKGMGYYETITELSLLIPIAFLFRTKCSPVAEDVGAELDKNIALLRYPETNVANKI